MPTPPYAQVRGRSGGLSPNGLSPAATADRELVLAQLRGQLLSLEDIRMWEKNPDSYTSYATSAIFTIMSRSFAPPAERLKSAIAREKLIPRMFQSARENLSNPPRGLHRAWPWSNCRASSSFFQNDVPAAFNKVNDAALLAEFQKSQPGGDRRAEGVSDLAEERPAAALHGDFRIGAENYRKKLLYDEMVDTPLDRLLAIGYENLHHNQE